MGQTGSRLSHSSALPLPCSACLLVFYIGKECISFLVYRASHEEKPTKDIGTHEGHASQHRSTTHPPLGVPSHAPTNARIAVTAWTHNRRSSATLAYSQLHAAWMGRRGPHPLHRAPRFAWCGRLRCLSSCLLSSHFLLFCVSKTGVVVEYG